MVIWKPSIPYSIDSKPLASKISDLFVEFPYDRLHPTTGLWMRPECVGLLLVGYLVSKPFVKAFGKACVEPKSAWFRYAVAVHNAALAIFSGVVAWNSWAIVIEHLTQHGLMAVYCEKANDASLWHAGFGAWALVFYISKFYEFLDTWILVLKGKQASFLQVYHHTGIAFIMWCAVASQSSWLFFVLLLNSVIHTLMYTYFFIKTVSPSTEIKAAKYLTMAQIGQFLTGILSSYGVFYLGDECASESSRFALFLLHVYGYGLVGLFFAFAKRKYKKR